MFKHKSYKSKSTCKIMKQKQTSRQKVKKNMKISEIIENYPDVIPVIMSYGLHCIGCSIAGSETLEQGAKAHGLPDDEIRNMIKDCNDLLDELGED